MENNNQEKEQKKAKKQQNAANNAQALRVAAKVAEKAPDPTIATIGKVVTAADKITNGKVTESLGRILGNSPAIKPLQGTINKLGNSGALDAANMAVDMNKEKSTNAPQTSKTPQNNAESSTTAKEKGTPKKGKNLVSIVLTAIALLFIISIILPVAVAIGPFMWLSDLLQWPTGTITLNNTDCDSNAENCSNKYDGEVEFEDYIAGVIAASIENTSNIEIYKAASISATTYFMNNVRDDYTVEGNSNFLSYIDVEDSENKDLIKQAVEETNGMVMYKDEVLADIGYNVSCIVNSTESDSYENILKGCYSEEIEIKNINISTGEGVNGFINPTNKIHCSSAYGNRTHPVKGNSSFHTGIDIGIPGGEPVYAVKSGIVTNVVNNVMAINNCSYGYGNYIMIDHQDGTSSLYAHLKYGSIPSYIYNGQTIEAGRLIGKVGSTGCSTGNHLHYEVRINGQTVDPADYLNLTTATGTCKR